MVSIDTNELLAEHIENWENKDRDEPWESDTEVAWVEMQDKCLDPMLA